MFISKIEGTLINLKEDEQSRYQCEIWFEYTRQNMEQIREGTLLAVPNFSSSPAGYRYNILEIVSLMPIHYGLGTNVSGYPGFVREAAKSAFTDWREQEDEVREDTTQIRILAIPTNLEIDENGDIDQETNLPMPGGQAYPIDQTLTHKIVNMGLDPTRNNLIVAGHLIRDPEIEVYTLVDELLQVHFGIFGFTGAGKSNLLSTLVAKLYSKKENSPTKFVFFDLMSEYATLALDLLVNEPGAYLVGLGGQTFPGKVVEYLAGDASKLDAAATAMAKTTLLPKALRRYSTVLPEIYATLLENNKIRIYQRVNPQQSIGGFISDFWSRANTGSFARKGQQPIQELIGQISQISDTFANERVAENTILRVRTTLRQDLGANGSKILQELVEQLSNTLEEFKNNPPLPDSVRITVPEMVEQLNSPAHSNLFIIQSHNPDMLRSFSSWLGNAAYEARRRRGQISPLVSFIFDEADEFIPQEASGTFRHSTEIAMTLARRGRKFGLGIGIATQRITYLNTSILAQPHTYFVSKLPRRSDRERIRDAFGLGDEMFRQTFKFKKGNWLLVSYDATGIEAVPIPIQTFNANTRLAEFFQLYT